MFAFLIHLLIEKFKPESYYLQINNMVWQMNSYNFELNQTAFHNKRFHNRLFSSTALFMFYKWPLRIEVAVTKNQGSRTIALEENCPPTPKLTSPQTLTLTEGLFSLGAIVWLILNPKTNPNLDPKSNPNRSRGGGGFPRGDNCSDTLNPKSNITKLKCLNFCFLSSVTLCATEKQARVELQL